MTGEWDSGRETCVCAALRMRDGTVFYGHRHQHCMMAASARHADANVRAAEQGFATTRRRFVGRKEALRLQLAAGIPSADPDGYRGDQLYSEDLY